MKKVFLMSVVLLVALMTQAQTKVAPKLENGFKAVYVEEITRNVGGQDQKMVVETEYVVSDVTAKGAVITSTLTDIKSEGELNDPMAQLTSLGENIMKGISIKLATDADGQVTSVLNVDEVKAKALELANTIIDGLMKEHPDIAQVLPKEALIKQITEQFTEKVLLANVKYSGVLALNGKTITSGATESVTNEQGMKMKRMYFLTGKNIIANSTLDMTKDDLKEFVIKQVKQLAPDQAEMISQNIDMVLGQMKFSGTSKSTYELQDNGWMKSIKSESNYEIMGQSEKQTSVITLK